MTDDELKAIRERLEKATPGPWRTEGSWDDDSEICSTSTEHQVWTDYDNGQLDEEHFVADAEFIAHAPTDIAALLAEVERLQERCEQLYYDGLEE